MRSIVLALIVLTISACSSEPEFDEHYETLSQDIEERAAKIESDLAQPEIGDDGVVQDRQKPQ